MLRRNFFATLLAPLVARFVPKKTPYAELSDALNSPGIFWTEYELKYACAIGTGYWKQIMEAENEAATDYAGSLDA